MSNKSLFIFPDGDFSKEPQEWIREGQYTRCGKCCEEAHHFAYLVLREKEEDHKNSEEESIERGFVTGKPIAIENWDGHRVWWQVREAEAKPCSEYLGHGVCRIWKEGIQEICHKWPLFPFEAKLFPECGFTFRKLETSKPE